MFESERHAYAYLMGVYLSDGHIRTRSGSFGLRVTDEEFRDTAAEALNLVGAKFSLGARQPGSRAGPVTGKVYDCKYVYQLREKSPYRVGRRLERVFPGGRDHLPSIPDDLARELVAGVMDGDRSISTHKRRRRSGRIRYQLKVCGYSGYLGDLRDLFAKHGVLMHYRPGKLGHSINLRSFVAAGFYFRMPRKQALVEAYRREVMRSELECRIGTTPRH